MIELAQSDRPWGLLGGGVVEGGRYVVGGGGGCGGDDDQEQLQAFIDDPGPEMSSVFQNT